jgi:hypothetical protein
MSGPAVEGGKRMTQLMRTYRGQRPGRFRLEWDVPLDDEVRKDRIAMYERRAQQGLPLFDEDEDSTGSPASQGLLEAV